MLLRRCSRIIAMQMLYQIHLTNAPVQHVIEEFWQNRKTLEELRPFAKMLVENTTTYLKRIDAELEAASQNWKLHRMPVVDLSILRFATCEILYIDDIEPAISIDEAIEIAKSYSTLDSPKFINGVLDSIHKKHSAASECQM